MGSLVGGPKDEDPPIVMQSSPANYSLNFDKRKIEITFNEFVVLKDINQQLVVSPPMEEKPIVRLKNKSILIDLESELRENTTYTLNFGEAIADNNEGNVLLNYEFVFSTGDYLDSLSVGGSLLKAFDLSPTEESVNIMLYDNLNDSVVFKEIPIYIGKTDKKGNFRINNLKADSFKIFALKDVNNNFLFDLPNEEIAFIEEPLIVNPEFFKELLLQSVDTGSYKTATDSTLIIFTDSTETESQDSLTRKALIKIPDQLMVDLYIFQEENTLQFLSSTNRKSRNKLDFSFSLPVSDSFYVESLIPARNNWFMQEMSANRDTFVYWIVDKEVREMDTIQLELNYVVQDSLNNPVWEKDSLYFVFRDLQKTGKKKDEKPVEENVLLLSGLKNKSTIDLNKKLEFISETPINYIDTSLIEFYIVKDTVEIRSTYKILRDSIQFRKVHFKKEWESTGKYHLIMYPGAVMDVFGYTTDTMDIKFNVRDIEYYGVLIVEADSLNYPAIFQLLDGKNKVVREVFLEEHKPVRFEYLAPGKYKMKFVEDQNANGKWDTGNYMKKRQPEKVRFYEGEIQIRANWDLDIKFNSNKPEPPSIPAGTN